MKFSCKTILLIVSLVFSIQGFSQDQLIFSVAEDIPMGYDNEVLKRNYYVNIGSNHGLSKGATLSVYRVISKSNPYDNKKRVNYKVEIGQLEVLHTEDDSAIGIVKKLNDDLKSPLFEINNFMIGDHVSVAVK